MNIKQEVFDFLSQGCHWQQQLSASLYLRLQTGVKLQMGHGATNRGQNICSFVHPWSVAWRCCFTHTHMKDPCVQACSWAPSHAPAGRLCKYTLFSLSSSPDHNPLCSLVSLRNSHTTFTASIIEWIKNSFCPFFFFQATTVPINVSMWLLLHLPSLSQFPKPLSNVTILNYSSKHHTQTQLCPTNTHPDGWLQWIRRSFIQKCQCQGLGQLGINSMRRKNIEKVNCTNKIPRRISHYYLLLCNTLKPSWPAAEEESYFPLAFWSLSISPHTPTQFSFFL